MTTEKKTNLQRQMEEATGLSVERLTTRAALESCLGAGLTELYRAVYAEPPWNESYTPAEVRDILLLSFVSGGMLFVARAGDRPVAFSVAVPLATVRSAAAREYEARSGVAPRRIMYFAEDGVDPVWRRRGISTWMKKLRMEAAFRDGFTRVVLRTNERNYREIGVVGKTGGAVVRGLAEEVRSRRLDGTEGVDRRVWYAFNLAARRPRPPEKLERVTILRGEDGRDTAVVRDAVPPRRRAALARKLRENYPGLSSVSFSPEVSSPRAVVFDGRLYVPGRRR